MKKIALVAAAAAAALTLGACDSAAEQKIDANTEAKADALENQADAVRQADPGINSGVTEAKADALEEKADAVRAEGEVKAEAQEAADKAAGTVAPATTSSTTTNPATGTQTTVTKTTTVEKK